MKKKVLSILLSCILFAGTFFYGGLAKAEALDQTQFEAIQNAVQTLRKISKLSKEQAGQAIAIANSIVENGDSWLEDDEIQRLKAKGLQRSDVEAALGVLENAIAGKWDNLVNPDTQIVTALEIVDSVKNALGNDFVTNLNAKGITIEELISAAISVANVQISSWDNLPKEAIGTIFDNFAKNTNLSRETAISYGLNWANVQEILNNLDVNQKNQLKSILITLGNWPTSPSGGPGGGPGGRPSTPDTKPISDKDLDKALEDAKTADKVVISQPAGTKEVALTVEQFAKIQDTAKPLQANIGQASLVIPPAAIPAAALEGAQQLQFGAAPVPPGQVQEVISQARNAGLFSLAGDVFELSATAVDKDGKKTYIREFNGKIQVSLPVPPNSRALAAQGKLTVCRYNEQTKTWEDLKGTYDEKTGTITFETDRFSKYAVMEVKAVPTTVVSFNDIKGHWAQSDIEFMAAKGFAGGVGNGQFAPEANITRAQFAAFLVRVLGVPEAKGGLAFSDVKAGDWYYGVLATAYEAGLIKGVSADKIAPNQNITREQMAVMIVRAMEYKGKTIPAAKDLAFTDKATVSPWAVTGVSQSAQMGLIGGFPNGSFAPQNNATRAQAIVILHRVFDQVQ